LEPLFKTTRNSWWGTKDVKPGVMDWGRAHGKQYGIPMGTGAYYALHINRNLWRAEGLPEPPLQYDTPSWTFDRILESAKRLTKRDASGAQQFGINRGLSWPFLLAVVPGWGGTFMDAKTGEFKWHESPATDAIQWMADLQLKHQVAPSTAENEGGAFDFEQGHLGLRWSTFNLAMYLLQTVGDEFDWDILPPPRQGNRRTSIWFYVSWWVQNQASRVTDAAWTFLHWVGGPGGERVSVEYCWSAPHFYSLDDKFGLRLGSAGAKKNLNVARDFLKYTVPDRPELNAQFSEALKVLNPALTKIADGELTARQAMTQIKPQMDQRLKQGLADEKR
ncbi:MAG: extracellular solute-binding protein, partial [Chloroflexota bacterium]